MADPTYNSDTEKLKRSQALSPEGVVEEIVEVVALTAFEIQEKENALIESQIATLNAKVAAETDSAGDLERLIQLKQLLGK